MQTRASLVRKVLGRGRRLGDRLQLTAGSLRSARRTALHIPPDRLPPPPRAFAAFGAGSWLVPPVRISGAEGIEVGDGVIVLEDGGLHVDAAAGARLVIGDRVRLAKGVEVVCTTRVTIGAAVSTSDYVTITDSWALLTGPVGAPPPPAGAPVVVDDGAYLGWGSVVGPGVHIGAGAFVGEGAVVLADVAPHTVVYGNPARAVGPADGTCADQVPMGGGR